MITVKLDTKEIDRIAKRLNVDGERVMVRYAFEVQAEAAQRAPYDTSALRNSIYVEAREGGQSFDSTAGAVNARRKDVETERHPVPVGNVVAHVGPCVEYAEYVELGTSRMSARPYLVPAVEMIARKVNSGEGFAELFK